MKYKIIELSEVQKGIYFECEAGGKQIYNIPAAVRVEADLDISKLSQVLKLLTEEQPVLRCGIGFVEDRLAMVLDDDIEIHIDQYDVSAADDIEADTKVIIKAEVNHEFDLSQAPLFRLCVIKRAQQQVVLLLNIHHLIADGVSMDILLNKIFFYYNKLVKEEEIVVVPDYSFFKFAETENQKLLTGAYERQKEYWNNRSKEAKPLNFPKDFRAKDNLGVGKEKNFILSDVLIKKIEKAASQVEVTPFLLSLSALSLLMGKCCNEEQVTLSTPFTYRPGTEYDNAVGCFIYTLPFTHTINNGRTFRDIVNESYEQFIGAHQNLGYPSNLIARDSFTAAYSGAQTIFDISFVYDKFTYLPQDGVLYQPYELDDVTFPGNMMITLSQMPEFNSIKIQYKENIYSDEMITILGKRLLRTFEIVTGNPDIQVKDIDLFLTNEKEQIMTGFNQSSFFKYKPLHITEFFEQKVQLYPDRTALVFEGGTLTYAEVNSRANQLARKIVSTKHKMNEIVGVQLNRSKEMVVAILAVLKAGCAYVPIENYYPEARKKYILDDADISICLTTSDLDDQFCLDRRVIYLDRETVYEGDDSNLVLAVSPYDLAYVEYTSGSTGEPKGVMIEHHSVINTIMDLERRFPVADGDVYLYKTPFSFDISGTELYGWFAGKGCLCIMEPAGEKNPDLILRYIENYKVTHINFVPTMFRFFLELFRDSKNIERVGSLKWIFVGGEAITPDIIEMYFRTGITAKLENVYGPTECTMWASNFSIFACEDAINVPIGTPLNEIRWYVTDEHENLQMIGVPGELCLSGVGLARGYLNKEELTNKQFRINPFYDEIRDARWYQKIYKTGDLVRWLPNGMIEFLGRIDSQVNINGLRVELGEIEHALGQHPEIVKAVVIMKPLVSQLPVLWAYYAGNCEIGQSELRKFLKDYVPPYMIPSFFVRLDELPVNSSGKIDRRKLMADNRYRRPVHNYDKQLGTKLEKQIALIWKEVLGVETIGADDNFFENGGHSTLAILAHNKLQRELQADLSVTALYEFPTIRMLSEFIMKDKDSGLEDRAVFEDGKKEIHHNDIAIVGMSINVPGAETLEDFWAILKEGKESIHFYSDNELEELGISDEVIQDKNYVKAKGRMESIDFFDTGFFGHTPNEVRLMSPQLRALYKGAWAALEDAGHYPGLTDDKIGVFVGGSDDFEWYQTTMGTVSSYSEMYETFTMSTNHFLATRLAYQFDFKGPAFSALTGCSTSLVTPHLACQSLILNECDIAIAGGVTIELPNDGGYMYYEGMMFSPDGHCRPFDSGAKGTVFSNGMGMVVLKRLEDAVAAGDHIYAVIKGSAINNDGSIKAGFAAPSVEGQTQAIQEAYKRSGIDPETVGYIEAHGTGTILGDPIEVSSLTKAFATDKKGYCTLGSVKGNIGHTDTAAGIVGLVKVALSLKNKYIPGTVNYQVPNPKIDFSQTPFGVSCDGRDWGNQDNTPLRAGINSFGVGGTNAHMVLEEFLAPVDNASADDINLFVFSGKTETALKNNINAVLGHLAVADNINYSDAAWTMMMGRKHFPYRKAVVIDQYFSDEGNADQVVAEAVSSPGNFAGEIDKICFMFSGQGNQYQGMGRDLYRATDVYIGQQYRMYADKIFGYLTASEKAEYFEVLFGDQNPELINQTKYSQFALFLSEYAISKIMMDLGVKPDMFIGHSIGEVTAAAVAGVWTLEDAVKIIKFRGEIMQKQQPGSMLAVMLNAGEVKRILPENLSLALDNTSDRCVVGGSNQAILDFQNFLNAKNIKSTIVRTSHAFHTHMMQEAAVEFNMYIKQFPMYPPHVPIVSNITGRWADLGKMATAEYWSRHIIETVRFTESLDVVLDQNKTLFIEVGAGRSLCTFAVQHQNKKESQTFVNLLRHPRELENDLNYFYKKTGQLWSSGLMVEWNKLWGDKKRKKVSLPTYQFDSIHYPIILADRTPNEQTPVLNKTADESRTIALKTGVQICSNKNGQMLIDAFVAVLGFENILETDDFFSLGGDSLKAVSLANYIANKVGIEIAVSEIFKYPTPLKMQEYLKTIQPPTDIDSPKTLITPLPKQPYYDTSYSQKRMFSLYQLEPDSTAYNMPSATIIEGLLDPVKVRNAVAQLVTRHDALRTSFAIIENQVVQIISENVVMNVEFEEKHLLDEQQIADIITNFVRPFDLSKAPLCRLKLVQIAADRSVLLFDIHHSVADGSSSEILTRDFNNLYSNVPMEPLTIQYKELTVWQNQFLQSEAIRSQKDYWLGQFSEGVPVLDMPLDRPRPEVKSSNGHRLYFSFDEELSLRIEAFARQHGVTKYMLLLSVWYLILARYSGQEDIVIGTPVAGRNIKEAADVIGFFLNTLAMRNRPGFDKRYLDFLNEVKENTLNALSNQEYPFDSLVEQLKVRRVSNRNAIFDVYFDYQNMDTHDIDIEGMGIRPFLFDTFSSVYDLVLTCHEYKDKEIITGTLDCASSLFEVETIERMIENFKTALRNVMTYPEDPLGIIDIISKEEETRILEQFEKTRRTFRETITVHRSFEEHVERYPDKTVLIVSDGTEYSYHELNQRANIIAHKLIASGVGPGDIVGIMTKRNVHLFASIIGVLKSGAAYVPLDASYPQQRIDYMIKQSRPKIILTDREISSQYVYDGTFIIGPELEADRTNTSNPFITMDSNALAIVIFTSGSTGEPKGVMLTHNSLINFVDDHIERKMCSPGKDRILSITTFSFDIFLFESIFPMSAGYSVYLADEIEQIDAAAVTAKVLKYQVTHLASTPSRVMAFAENPAFEPALKQLKYVICGGEVYPHSLLRMMQHKAGSDTSILTVYGPTETTIWMTIKDLTKIDYINIGSPISNVQVFILNRCNKLQPYGVYGEICISGKGVSKGYYNNIEETEKRFIKLAEPLNTKVYKTGDRGRMLPNGEFDILGRFDNQVKIRGYRVELGEIDKTALKFGRITHAVAKVFVDNAGSNGIQLFYCLDSNDKSRDPDFDEKLRKWLESQLPNYMIPAQIICLDQMPTTPNGKIDKNALMEPKQVELVGVAHREAAASVILSRYQVESKLLEIWKEILGKDSITITDNFFDIGGTSLGVMLVNNRINKDLGIVIPVMKLFEYSTVQSLAEVMVEDGLIAAANPITQCDLFDDFADDEGEIGFKNCSDSGLPLDLNPDGDQVNDIAVIGMTCRFPDADSIEQYWENLMSGKESIRFFGEEELRASGISEETFRRENYVPAKGYLDCVEYFDHKLFDYSEKEAALMDPQIRMLHQCIYELLEKAGYHEFDKEEKISLFAGSSPNLPWMSKFFRNQENFLELFEAMTFNEKDFLTTRIAYKMNLKGPAMTVQTACSTSLVAIHQACKSIINGDAGMAIAGGVSITYPRKEGYLWHPDMILSKDGHCRPFSNDATGTVTGNGCGVILLKSLKQARKDGDNIYAVIKGSAINNDGIDKVGYTAPSIKGQRDTISTALKQAKIKAEEICYVEAHGTGTVLGDPIEVEALRRAFDTQKTGYCALGSVKANIGHLDAAAGVAGFIKAVMILHHKVIPPQINFAAPNDKLDLKNSPFYINNEAQKLFSQGTKLKAGVSSFGIGGTNVHMILEGVDKEF